MSLSTRVELKIKATASKAIGLANPSVPAELRVLKTLTDGTGLDKADILWQDRRQLGGGANEDLDLAGVLKDLWGDTVTMACVKAILIENTSDLVTADHAVATNAEIQLGAPAVNGVVGIFKALGNGVRLPVGAADAFLNPSAAGWGVTAGSGDLLNVENLDAIDQAQYDIIIVGASATS